MAYTTNIPAATDIPAQSQPLMQDNCNTIASAFAVDHGPFNAATEGQHDKISFTGSGTIPATNFGLYATAAAIFLHDGANNYDITSVNGPYVINGYNCYTIYTPSGLLIKFGIGAVAGTLGQATLNLDAAGAAYPVAVTPFVFLTGCFNVNAFYTSIRSITHNQLVVNVRYGNTAMVVGDDAMLYAPAGSEFNWLTIGSAV